MAKEIEIKRKEKEQDEEKRRKPQRPNNRLEESVKAKKEEMEEMEKQEKNTSQDDDGTMRASSSTFAPDTSVDLEADVHVAFDEVDMDKLPEEKPSAKMRSLAFARVFPSEEETISCENDDVYGGAHLYTARLSEGFADGKAIYTEDEALIQFVQANEDGTMRPGLQSEQLVLILIDRHQKLHSKFPSPYTHDMLKGLNMFLNASRQRVHDRINRGVMGNLKK
jgi:hypothetical protein